VGAWWGFQAAFGLIIAVMGSLKVRLQAFVKQKP